MCACEQGCSILHACVHAHQMHTHTCITHAHTLSISLSLSLSHTHTHLEGLTSGGTKVLLTILLREVIDALVGRWINLATGVLETQHELIACHASVPRVSPTATFAISHSCLPSYLIRLGVLRLVCHSTVERIPHLVVTVLLHVGAVVLQDDNGVARDVDGLHVSHLLHPPNAPARRQRCCRQHESATRRRTGSPTCCRGYIKCPESFLMPSGLFLPRLPP